MHWVVMDAGYADLDTLSALAQQGLAFCAGVKGDFGVRVPDEVAAWIPPAPAPQRRGRPRLHPDPRSQPTVYRVDTLRAALPAHLWRAVTYREGSAGLLTKEFAAIRVLCATVGRTGPEVWLLFERPLGGGPGEYKQYVLSSRQEMTLDEMAQVAHRRPRVERYSYENGKGEAGLSDYQGRSWPGFHHHLAMVMLALTWLTLQRQPLSTPADPPFSTSGTEPRPELPPQTSIPVDGEHLTFRVAPIHPRGVPIPRPLWESVQAVRRRWLQWCAIAVHRFLARCEQPVTPPAFARLC